MECDVVNEYAKGRGLPALRKKKDLVECVVGSLKIGVWCPREEFPDFSDVEYLRQALHIDSLDVLIIVAYRPYVLVDYISSLLERAYRWYGLRFEVKLLGVSSIELETGLEEAFGRAFVEKPHKLDRGIETEDLCPQCTKGLLKLYRREKFFSKKYRGRVVESIYGCSLCGFKTRSLQLLD
ncbi:MAG: hypothetical protein ACK4M3_00740 [Pyrobaculum sp.]